MKYRFMFSLYIIFFALINFHNYTSATSDDLILNFYNSYEELLNPNAFKDGSAPVSFEVLEDFMDYTIINDSLYIYAIIQCTDSDVNFENYGIQYNSKVNNIYTAFLSRDQYNALLNNDDILRIVPSVKCEPSLDSSLNSMNVDAVIDSFDLDGSGVIVGIIDDGIDYYNPDFQNLTDTTTRILYYFNTLIPDGPSPFNYGTEYRGGQIDSMQVSSNIKDYFCHGTPVTGIACGNGKNTANGIPACTYRGVAPNANIICYDLYTQMTKGRVIDGANYIMNKADSLQFGFMG